MTDTYDYYESTTNDYSSWNIKWVLTLLSNANSSNMPLGNMNCLQLVTVKCGAADHDGSYTGRFDH